jgi:hypothetical protein
MGYARNCAKWRRIQKDPAMSAEDSKIVAIALIFLSGFLCCGASWLLIPIVLLEK